jgi:hypothetical protein
MREEEHGEVVELGVTCQRWGATAAADSRCYLDMRLLLEVLARWQVDVGDCRDVGGEKVLQMVGPGHGSCVLQEEHLAEARNALGVHGFDHTAGRALASPGGYRHEVDQDLIADLVPALPERALPDGLVVEGGYEELLELVVVGPTAPILG